MVVSYYQIDTLLGDNMRMFVHYEVPASDLCVGMVLEGNTTPGEQRDLITVNVVTHVDRDAFGSTVVTVAEIELATEKVKPPRFFFYEDSGLTTSDDPMIVGFGSPVHGVNNFHLFDLDK